ncbi:MAG: hypothetical protein HY738_00585, partial [Bacteroidia bacterium]|nr:hypothetical protein [Bacteroidia bacterium]
MRLNTLSQGDKFGSKNLFPVIICTNDTERASLTTDGMFVLNYFAGSSGIVYHNNDGTFHSVLLDGDDTKFLNANGQFTALPADNDWQVSGDDMVSIPAGNVGIGVSPSTKLDIDGSIQSRSSLFVRDNLLFEGSGTNKITTNSHNLIFADTRIGFGIDPDPLYTVNIGGDAHVSGCLYVNQGVIIGQRI